LGSVVTCDLDKILLNASFGAFLCSVATCDFEKRLLNASFGAFLGPFPPMLLESQSQFYFTLSVFKYTYRFSRRSREKIQSQISLTFLVTSAKIIIFKILCTLSMYIREKLLSCYFIVLALIHLHKSCSVAFCSIWCFIITLMFNFWSKKRRGAVHTHFSKGCQKWRLTLNATDMTSSTTDMPMNTFSNSIQQYCLIKMYVHSCTVCKCIPTYLVHRY
jgi:hypothetical protein